MESKTKLWFYFQAWSKLPTLPLYPESSVDQLAFPTFTPAMASPLETWRPSTWAILRPLSPQVFLKHKLKPKSYIFCRIWWYESLHCQPKYSLVQTHDRLINLRLHFNFIFVLLLWIIIIELKKSFWSKLFLCWRMYVVRWRRLRHQLRRPAVADQPGREGRAAGEGGTDPKSVRSHPCRSWVKRDNSHERTRSSNILHFKWQNNIWECLKFSVKKVVHHCINRSNSHFCSTGIIIY